MSTRATPSPATAHLELSPLSTLSLEHRVTAGGAQPAHPPSSTAPAPSARLSSSVHSFPRPRFPRPPRAAIAPIDPLRRTPNAKAQPHRDAPLASASTTNGPTRFALSPASTTPDRSSSAPSRPPAPRQPPNPARHSIARNVAQPPPYANAPEQNAVHRASAPTAHDLSEACLSPHRPAGARAQIMSERRATSIDTPRPATGHLKCAANRFRAPPPLPHIASRTHSQFKTSHPYLLEAQQLSIVFLRPAATGNR